MCLYISTESPSSLILSKWEDYFKSIWEYRFKKNLLFNSYLEGVEENILEGDRLKQFNSECEELASKIYLKYPYDSWIKFLKTLCKLFFEYRKREKYKLSECLKNDIRCVIYILMEGSKKSYRDIIDAVEPNSGKRNSLLERIYPEYESYLKREGTIYLKSALTSYNEVMPDFLKLNETSIGEIIDYAFESENETLLISVIGVNKEYLNPSYFGEEGLWSFIRSLAVATESWVKKISETNKMKDALVKIFGGDFESCCNKLKEKLKETCDKPKNLNVYSYADLKQLLNVLSTTQFEINGKDLSWMKYVVRAYLMRNYIAHHTQLDAELFGKTLVELYNSLLYLVFCAWRSKKKS